MDALSVRAVLARTPGLTARHVRELVGAAGGDISRILESELLARADIPNAARSFLGGSDYDFALNSDRRWIDASGARLIAASDPEYPPLLSSLPLAPAVLFVLGDAALMSTPQVAMVGARNATIPGCRNAYLFAEAFALAGLTVTSGLAVGIDAHSHLGALCAEGGTIAVCATGLDRVYPAQHASLARRIQEQGALLSCFPPGTAPLRRHFPLRNELLSALSIGTVVVEAALRSGSLLTAAHARRQRRMVFALPGPPGVAASAGCHLLIRNGATLVEHPAQVLQELKIPHKKEVLAGALGGPGAPAALDKASEMLLDAVGFEPATVDLLVVRTGLTGELIASMLLVLELQGHIASYPGGRYGRIPR